MSAKRPYELRTELKLYIRLLYFRSISVPALILRAWDAKYITAKTQKTYLIGYIIIYYSRNIFDIIQTDWMK